jgi:hypothetical protein
MKSKPFAKFLQKPRFRVQDLSRCTGLATQIIEKELDLDKSITLSLVQELTGLYTKAIEHYEAQENPKYLDFQEKLQKMLIKPQVFALLNPKAPTPTASPVKSRETKSDKSIENFDIDESAKEDHRKLMSSQFASNLVSNNLMGVINDHSFVSKETSESVKIVIKSQEQDLEAKVQARKMRKSRRTPSMNLNTNEFFQCDMSSVDNESVTSTKSSLFNSIDLKENYDRYEKKLEEIMEKVSGDKVCRIMEIRKKYEKEIEELSHCGGVFDLVVDEMRKNMQNEIKETSEFYDQIRNSEIKRLKEDINN